MSARGKAWLIGLPITALLLGSIARDESCRELGVPLALLSVGVNALIAEATQLRALARGRMASGLPEGARPADGVVDVDAMAGVRAEPIASDARWRRFDRLEDDGPGRNVPLVSRATPSLLGHVTLISVFVGLDGRPWTGAEIARAHESMESAGRWIEREASRHDAPVNLGLADTFFQVEDDADEPVEVDFQREGDDFGPLEAHASSKHLIAASRAAARLGFLDIADWLARVNPRVEADARVWLVHLRRAGRSIAIPAAESDVSGVGLAICYAREASFPEPLTGPGRVDPTTVAHELLHLFGASDKYGVPLRSFPPGSVSSRDVMRLDFDSLQRMTIDRLTASEIGWNPASQPRGKKKPAIGR